MREIITDQRVVRYVAFNNPRTWVEHADTSLPRPEGACSEVAIYCHSVPNRHWEHVQITGTIYVEVVSCQDAQYLVRAFFESPTRGRWQHSSSFKTDDWEQAKAWAQSEIRRLERLLMRVQMTPADDGKHHGCTRPDYARRMLQDLPVTPLPARMRQAEMFGTERIQQCA